MKIALMTDSNSTLTADEAAAMGVYVLPMPIIINDEVFFENETLSEPDFYTCLTNGHNVTTSQPSPGDLLNLWQIIFSQGYDEIIYIPMASGLSSSCYTAATLAEDFDGKIFVVDNHRISLPQRQSVLDAYQMIQNHYEASVIKEYLENHAYDYSIYITVENLSYLQRGGRITPLAATLAGAMNIKPILAMENDIFNLCGKCRGTKKSRSKMIEKVRNDLNDKFKDCQNTKIGVATSFQDKALALEWKQEVAEAFPGYEIFHLPLSFSIGCHVGPNSIGIGVFQYL